MGRPACRCASQETAPSGGYHIRAGPRQERPCSVAYGSLGEPQIPARKGRRAYYECAGATSSRQFPSEISGETCTVLQLETAVFRHSPSTSGRAKKGVPSRKHKSRCTTELILFTPTRCSVSRPPYQATNAGLGWYTTIRALVHRSQEALPPRQDPHNTSRDVTDTENPTSPATLLSFSNGIFDRAGGYIKPFGHRAQACSLERPPCRVGPY